MNQIHVENEIKGVLNILPMSRTKGSGEKKTEYTAAKVTPAVKKRLTDLMQEHDRTESYVLNVLIEYALQALDDDVKLFERKRGETVDMPVRTVAKKSATPKRNAK